eukprot:7389366-Prymnesium_polylepis.2
MRRTVASEVDGVSSDACKASGACDPGPSSRETRVSVACAARHHSSTPGSPCMPHCEGNPRRAEPLPFDRDAHMYRRGV